MASNQITLLPPPDLNFYIDSILIETMQAKESIEPYVVLPSPHIVLGFQYRGRLNQINEQGCKKLNQSGLSGLQTTYRIFQGNCHQSSLTPFAYPIINRTIP